MWLFVIGFEVTDISDKPVAFILKVASTTKIIQERVYLTLHYDSNMLETLRSVD
jgi:hypothetical protein